MCICSFPLFVVLKQLDVYVKPEHLLMSMLSAEPFV